MHNFTVSLNVEGMKHAVKKALDEDLANVTAEVQAAIDAACTPTNIARIIQASVDQELQRALAGAVEHFYRYGEGQTVVSHLVYDHLRRHHQLAQGATAISENARICEGVRAVLTFDESEGYWYRSNGQIKGVGRSPAAADADFARQYSDR